MAAKHLLWDFTSDCNLRCIHCYNSDMIISAKQPLQKNESLNNVWCIIKRISELGFKHIHLLGGEPLMSTSLHDVLKVAAELDISISINTNGTLLTEEMCRKLIKENVSQIIISLDGTAQEDNDTIRGSGVFKQVTNNIRVLSSIKSELQSDVLIELAVVVTKVGIHRIHQIIMLAKNLGVNVVNVSALYHYGNASKHRKVLSVSGAEYYLAIKRMVAYALAINQRLQIDCKSIVLNQICNELGLNLNLRSNYDSCQAGKNMIYMNESLNLYPCGPYASRNPNGLLMTNLFNPSAQEIMHEFATKVEEMKMLPREAACNHCTIKANCSLCSLCKTQTAELCAVAMNEKSTLATVDSSF